MVWVKRTSQACHTRDLRYRDELIRIDGAPSMADFGAFLIELFEAVNETLADEARFTQFASDVLNGGYPVNSADDLREEVMAWNAYEGELLALSLGLHTGTKVDWGAGRMDALQMIFNRISGMYASPIAGELLTSNIKLADSPTRPPFLWDTDKQDRSQWTGFAENHTEDLHLGRNYGQVLGVFANLTVSKDPTFPTAFSLDYTSQNSANLEGLVKLEKSGVKKIGPPKWPWTGDHPQAIDVKKAARGKIIFGRTPQEGECFKCHGEQRSRLEYFKGNELTGYWQTPILFTAKATQDPTTGEPGIVPDSTDTRQCDVISSVKSLVDTGIFEGELVQGKRVGDDQCWGNKFPEKLPSTLMLKWVVQNATGQTNERRFQTSLPAIIEAGKACELPQAPPLPEGACAYESRVLSGIWASAPYLHNGSVGSLRELLEKPEARKNSFAIGTHFDPNTVGLSVDQPEGSYVLETTGCATNEERNSGNSNCGHDYGTDLSTLQKLDLLEYLKTL